MPTKIIFKIGHKAGDVYHERGGGIFYPWLNCSEETSPYYEPSNRLLSEFSSIRQIMYRLDEDKYQSDYLGICHYRCLIGDLSDYLQDGNIENYWDLLQRSSDIISKTLVDNPGGIISTTYNQHGLKNWQLGPRWTGSKSIEYLIKVIRTYHYEYLGMLMDYLNDTENSFKVACVLPREDFIRIFSLVSECAQELIECRYSNGNDLTPRSVGYELETLTSALLTTYWKTHHHVARVKHTIIKL